MRLRNLVSLFIVAYCSSVVGCADTRYSMTLPISMTPTTVIPTRIIQSRFDNITPILQSYIDRGILPGLSLLIIRPDKTVYTQAFGTFTTNTVVTIASALKMPSVVAIMTLIEQGKLALDDRVNRYLPYWPPDKSAITIRQLLSHISGLPSYPSCVYDSTTTLDKCTRIIAQLPLQSPPGKEFNYGGGDYQVAGRIAEVISGKSWAQFFQQQIGIPCGRSQFTYGDTQNPRIGGSASLDLQDYALLLLLRLNGGFCRAHHILSQSALEEMRKDQIGTTQIGYSPYPDGRHYGLGWWIDPSQDNAATEFSDAGAFGSIPWIDLGRNYGAILLTQTDWQIGQMIWNQVNPIIQSDFDTSK